MDCGTVGSDGMEEQLEKIVSRWDDPYYDVQQAMSEPNVGKTVSEETAVDTFSLRQLDHYNWLERLEPSVLFQVWIFFCFEFMSSNQTTAMGCQY